MRLLFLLLSFLLGCTPALAEPDIPDSTKEMVHLTVTATNVRLRAGAGTEFEVLGMASRNDKSARLYVADSTPRMDSTGKLWFKLIANIQMLTEMSILKFDTPCWIRSDFAQTRKLRDCEAEMADSVFFDLLHVSLPDACEVAAFVPARDIPICATEVDCLWAEGRPVINAALPTGETFYFWGDPSKTANGDMCINVYKQMEPGRAKIVGCMPRKVFDAFDFGRDSAAVMDWKRKKDRYWK